MRKLKKTLRSFWGKVQPRDMIALPILAYSMYLIGKGINSIVSGIVIMIVTYYFSKRLYEEKNR